MVESKRSYVPFRLNLFSCISNLFVAGLELLSFPLLFILKNILQELSPTVLRCGAQHDNLYTGGVVLDI